MKLFGTILSILVISTNAFASKYTCFYDTYVIKSGDETSIPVVRDIPIINTVFSKSTKVRYQIEFVLNPINADSTIDSTAVFSLAEMDEDGSIIESTKKQFASIPSVKLVEKLENQFSTEFQFPDGKSLVTIFGMGHRTSMGFMGGDLRIYETAGVPSAYDSTKPFTSFKNRAHCMPM